MEINQKIVLNEQAIQQFSSHSGPISIISACGDYRTGKSYLLNLLFNPQNPNSPSFPPCTKGITMLKQPIKHKQTNIWVLDTEGFGSMTQDGRYDAKIMLLAMLVSDGLIYNSMGALDQGAIEKMAAICGQALGVTREVENQEEQEGSGDGDDWVQRDVRLYWVLRDFALSLTDKNGESIDADQYLEQALDCNSQKSSQQRKIIKSLFNQRKCFPLVRPCISQTSLQSLKSLPIQTLRPQFLLQLESLHCHILSSLPPKTLHNHKITGPQFTLLLRQYITMINQHNFTTSLSVTWEQVLRREGELLLERVQDRVREKIGRYWKFVPLSGEDLDRLRRDIQLVYQEEMGRVCHGVDVRKEFQEIRDREMAHFIQDNDEKLEQKCSQYLDQCYKQITGKLQKLPTLQNFNQKLQTHLQTLHKNFQTRYSPHNPAITLPQYNKTLHKLLTHMSTKILTKMHNKLLEKDKNIERLQREVKKWDERGRAMGEEGGKLREEVVRWRGMYQGAVGDREGYEEVLGRMERVNEGLRVEFGILSAATEEIKKQFQQKIAQYQSTLKNEHQRYTTLQTTLQSQLTSSQTQVSTLQSQLQAQEAQHLSQLQHKKALYIQMLSTEREQFNALLMERNRREGQLREELVQAADKGRRDRELMESEMGEFREQCQGVVRDCEERAKKETERVWGIIGQLENQIATLNSQNQILNQDILKQRQQLQSLSTKLQQQTTKSTQLQAKLTQQTQLHLQHTHTKTFLLHTITNHQTTITSLQHQLSTLQQKHSEQLQTLTAKLQENLHQSFQASVRKEQLGRKEAELEREAVAGKLVEAAERIERMVEKERKMGEKLGELQGRLREGELGREDAQGEIGRLRDVIQVQAKQIEKLGCKLEDKDRREQELRRMLDESTGTRKRAKSVKQNQNQTESLQILKHKVQTYKAQTQTLLSQLQTLKTANQCPPTLLSLQQQNKALHLQLETQKQATQKYQSEVYKKINLHSLFKKLGSQEALDRGEGDGRGDLGRELGEEREKNRGLCRYVEELECRELELRAEICELSQITVNQAAEISHLRTSIEERDIELRDLQAQQQKLKQILEQSLASHKLTHHSLQLQLQTLTRKHNIQSKELTLWKVRATHYENTRQEDRNSGYRDKIDNLFNNL